MDAGAIVSEDGRYRYRLWRAWGTGPRLGWLMLNPSTADGRVDDPTIRKCVGFARRNGFDGIEVSNLFALRSTDPTSILLADYDDAVGPENDEAIALMLERVPLIVLGWGTFEKFSPVGRRRREVLAKLETAAAGKLRCIGRRVGDRAAAPRHPVMAAYQPLEAWTR